MLMKTMRLIFMVGMVFLAVNSCRKGDLRATLDEVLLSQQETQTDEVLFDIDLIADEAINQNSTLLKAGTPDNAWYLSSCATVTLNTKSTPQILTIDFGTSCTGRDGKVRSGKIIISSDGFNTFPSVRKKSFENYIVDNKKITGTIEKSIQKDADNKIRTANSKEDITIQLTDQQGTVHRVADITRQYQLNSSNIQDNSQVKSWGVVAFTRAGGEKFTKTIAASNPLVFSASCHHIVSGIVNFSFGDGEGWSINFGDGSCDNKAIVTRGTKSREITIR